MGFGLVPGKLGFKIGDVLVGLQEGTTDVPETIASTQNKLHTVGYLWNPDTLAFEVPQTFTGLTDAELRATPVPVSGPLTDAELRATPVEVNLQDNTEVHAFGEMFVQALHGSIHSRLAYRFRIMGSRINGWSSTSVLGDAAEYLDTSQPRINDVSTGTTYYIRSSSASDTSAGTGARTVRIFYLDSAGDMATTTATMNGTTPVSLGTGFSYFLWAEVATVGSNTVSVGNITISSNAGGAPAVSEIVEQITANGNRSLSGRFKVPTGFTGYLVDWQANAISTTMDVRIRGDFFQDTANGLSQGVFHFIDRAFLASGGNTNRDLHYQKVPSGAEVKISAIPGLAPAGNKLDCDFDILILADVTSVTYNNQYVQYNGLINYGA